jgi:hypothetical protein
MVILVPNIQSDSKLLLGFPWSIIFNAERTKLFTEFESVTQKALFSIESVLQNAKQLQQLRLLWHISSYMLLFPV